MAEEKGATGAGFFGKIAAGLKAAGTKFAEKVNAAKEARAEKAAKAAEVGAAPKKGGGWFGGALKGAWKKAGQTNIPTGPATGLFVFVLMLHFVDLLFGRLSGQSDALLFLALAVFYLLIALYAPKVLGISTRESFIISGIALFLPNIVAILVRLLPMFPTDIVNFLLVFMPIWPIYLLLAHSEKIGKVLKWIGWLYFIFWILIFFLAYSGPIKEAVAVLGTQEIAGIQPGTAVKEMFAKAKVGFVQMYNATVSYKQKQAQQLQALGFYEGQVDSKSKEQLGVYFGELQSLKQEYSSQEFVDIFTTLSAQTLDTASGPLTIAVSCSGPDGLAGEITPESSRLAQVENFDQLSIDCVIRNGFVVATGKTESKTITIAADFGFSTMSYLRSYFMDQERLRTLRRMSIDPLSQYGITDKNPKAISTSGPVLIGMSIGEQLPIGIDPKGNQILTLGITLSNKWTGKLKNINKLTLVLPKGIQIEKDGVLPQGAQFVSSNCFGIVGCDDKIQNVYQITGIALPRAEVSYTTIRIMLKVVSPGDLLGVSPLAIKSIWAIAGYDYRLEKAKTISIRGPTQ